MSVQDRSDWYPAGIPGDDGRGEKGDQTELSGKGSGTLFYNFGNDIVADDGVPVISFSQVNL